MARRLKTRGARRWGAASVLAVVAMGLAVPRPASAQSDLPANPSDAGLVPVASAEDTNGVAPNLETLPKAFVEAGPKPEMSLSGGLDPRARYRLLIQKEAAGTGLAPEIAEAVMGAESSYDPSALSSAGAIGLMQVLPSTARMLGFTGTDAQLAEPSTNIHYGVTYLAEAWRLAGGDLCTAAMKYRAGHGESRFSHLSVNYCLAVRSRLVAQGFRVTGNVPVATFGAPGGGDCRRRCLGGGRVGNINLAALNTRLSALVMQVRTMR